MCGFAGFVGRPDLTLLDRMAGGVRHRGPDQQGVFSDAGCSLAHQRLSIIDLSEAGRQPMATSDGRFVVAYNGEIYNYKALRERYAAEGWAFRSATDTECLLASAALHGLDDLRDFHGMFAFLLWDTKERVLWAARDRMGIKPLYVAEADGRRGFASEPGALLPLRRVWDEDVVARSMYFTVGYVPGPRTMFVGMQALPPGRLFRVDAGSLSEAARFDRTDPVRVPARERAAALRAMVDAAVAAQTVSDRPVGLFLSGGLDSSVVLSAMRMHAPGAPIKTFTTRFRHEANDPKFNIDADLARRTAERYGCDHAEIEVGGEDVVRELGTIALRLGQPHSNSAMAAVDAAARRAARDVAVVLTGDGGDELFGGYRRYELWSWAALPLRHRALRAAARRLSRLHPKAEAWGDLLSASDEAARLLTFHALPDAVRKARFGAAADAGPALEAFRGVLSSAEASGDVARFMALDRATWLRDDAFVRLDRLTMRHGLEARVPLLDDALAAFALGLPAPALAAPWAGKRLWREAFAERCIPEVARGVKRGWITPAAKWLREGVGEWMRDVLQDAAASHPWLDGPAVLRDLEDHRAHRAYRLIEIWTVASYHLWWKAHRSVLRPS